MTTTSNNRPTNDTPTNDTPSIDSSGIDWTALLLEQLDWHWVEALRPRLEGLTDDEYLWEPAPGWNIRPRAKATSPMAVGARDTVMDYAYPEPDPAPITTIAWRMYHVSVGVLGMRASNHFGDRAATDSDRVDYDSVDYALDAATGLAVLDDMYRRWTDGVRRLDADALAAPCGPNEGPFAEYPMAALVLHITREVIHHGAEMCLLRDLYGARTEFTSPRTSPPT